MRLLLILICLFLIGCTNQPIVRDIDSNLRVEESSESMAMAIREFPTFALQQPVRNSTGFKPPIAQPSNDESFIPDLSDHVFGRNPVPFPYTAYAFTKANSATTAIGKIYYSDGFELPYQIVNNAHSPMPSGDWVFYIQPPGANPPGPARWNSITDEIQYLDTTMIDPPCNALVPADDGNAYLYTAINTGPPDTLQGWIHIVKNGSMIWSSYGSYLFPTLSADASTAAWCKDSNPNTFGDRDAYVFDIQTSTATKIFNVGSTMETQYTALGRNGRLAGFTVAINGPDGLHDQNVYRWQDGSSFQIDTGEYRWCERVEISDLGKYQTFCGNKDPYIYAGYSVLCVREGIWESYEVTDWNSSIQDVWPDVADDGFIIYGNGVGYWSHYIPSLAHADEGYLGAIIDPGGVNRDFSFKN